MSYMARNVDARPNSRPVSGHTSNRFEKVLTLVVTDRVNPLLSCALL